VKKVLVTGSLGFIGTNLIKNSLMSCYHIEGLDSLVSSSQNLKYTPDILHHKFDLSDATRLESLIQNFDCVVHLAAAGNVVDSIADPLSNFDSNVRATINVLEAMKKSTCKNIVFASTGGALMGRAPLPVSESSLPSPISPYGASKLACEGYINAYCESYGLNACIFRFGNVYGPYSSHKKGVVNTWIKRAKAGKCIEIYGDGSSSRDYVHSSDLTNGIAQGVNSLLEGKIIGADIFHLSSERQTTLLDLYKILESHFKSIEAPEFLASRAGEVDFNYANCTKARKELGYRPLVSFEQGISDLIQSLD